MFSRLASGSLACVARSCRRFGAPSVLGLRQMRRREEPLVGPLAGIPAALMSEAEWTRIGPLTECYSDQHLGRVDAGLITGAERLGLTTIATLGRRQLCVVRPSDTKGAHADLMTTASAAP